MSGIGLYVDPNTLHVGIGTDDPGSASLFVDGDINFTGDLKQGGLPFIGSRWERSNLDISYTPGNVGIGTSDTNDARLKVEGDIAFTGRLIQNGIDYQGSKWSQTGSNIDFVQGNVGIGTSDNAAARLTVDGDIKLSGNILNDNNEAIWIPGSSVKWRSADTPSIDMPSGIAWTPTTGSNTAIYRYIGTDFVYNFNVIGSAIGLASPASPTGSDVLLTLPFPIDYTLSAYSTQPIVVGTILVTITPTGPGVASTTYTGYARTSTNSADAMTLVLRYVTGNTDRPLSDMSTAGSAVGIRIQGQVTYTTPIAANNVELPITYTPGTFEQDNDGKIIYNGLGAPPQAQFQVVAQSNVPAFTPAMIVDQKSPIDGALIADYRGDGISKASFDTEGNLRISGQLRNSSNETVWLPGTAIMWKQAVAPAFVSTDGLPTIAYTSSNATFRYVGNEIIYNFRLSGNIVAQPPANVDFKLQLQYPILEAAYPMDTIVGDLWLNVSSNQAGGPTATTFKAYAKTISASANVLATRYLNGALDLGLATIAIGSSITLQGTLVYQTSNVAVNFRVPLAEYRSIIQDQDDNIIINGGGAATRARFEVVETREDVPVMIGHYNPPADAEIKADMDIFRITRTPIGAGASSNEVFNIRQNGDVRISGNILDTNSNAVWIPGSTLQWRTGDPPNLNAPTGLSLTYASSNALYRYIGDEFVYNFNVEVGVTGTVSDGEADYTLQLSQPIKTDLYDTNPQGSIIGSLVVNVYSASSGASNTYPGYAKTDPTDPTRVILRYINGTYDRPMADILSGNMLKLQGQITYTTPLIANNVVVPLDYVEAMFVQDQVGNVVLNGNGAAPQGAFDIRQTTSSILPTIIANQPASSTGDLMHLRKNNANVVTISNSGNITTHGSITASNLFVIGDYVKMDTITSNTEQIVITNAGTGPALMVTQTGENSIAEFYDGDGGAIALKIANNGLVGIGVTNPQEMLHVNGTARIDGAIVATGSVTGSSFIGNASTATTLATPRNINGVSFNGGANITVTANTPSALTRGSYLTGNNFNGSAATTWAVDATNANLANKVVARDASGNFNAGTITAALAGNASTATTLATSRTINGVSFNGSTDITVTANTPSALTRGSYLTGNNFDGSATSTWAVDATDANVASKVVARDASGNFNAGSIRAANGTVAAPSFSWSAGSNAGFYLPATDQVGVVTAGIEQMRVIANGNVGVGTTNPTTKLHVIGTVKATSFVGDGSLLTGITSTGGGSGTSQWSQNGSNIYIIGSNVGIGTTNPQKPLDIVGDFQATSVYQSSVSYSYDHVWTTRASAADNDWHSLVWAPELSLFVAVTYGGINRVMTSPNGITWTSRTSAVDNQWLSVTWAPELSIFVAVANSGVGNRVMTSPDGIIWTSRTSPVDNQWISVVWAPQLSIFVAVASTGSGNRVMTSPDGINWTARTSAADNTWRFVTWSPQLFMFVAVAQTGSSNRVMTSSNGINWTLRTSAADNNWQSVKWSPELSIFVAVADSGVGNRVMTSPDGFTWTIRTSPADNGWRSVTWASELSLFVAVAYSGSGNRVMTSQNGINWTTRTSAADNDWLSVTWAPELSIFAAVASTGVGNRVMTSSALKTTTTIPGKTLQWKQGNLGINTASPSNALHVVGSIKATSNISSDAQFLGQALDSAAAPSFSFIANSNTGIFQPATSNIAISTGGIERMRVVATGSVGIGTTNPLSTLHVNGTAQATTFSGSGASLTSLPSSSLTGIVSVSNGGTGVATITANKVIVGNGTSNILQPANLHWDNTNSRLGVGTTSPSQALDVIGTVKATTFVGDGSLLTGISGGGGGGSGNLMIFGDTQVVKHAFGGHEPAVTGNYYVGANISWSTTTTSETAKAHLSVKCSMSGSDIENAYRRFDTIVHCKNDEVSLKPKGIINAETANFYTDAFSGLTHEVVRSTATSIDVKVKWSSTLAPYVTNALFEMIAPVALGSVSFSNIYGTF